MEQSLLLLCFGGEEHKRTFTDIQMGIEREFAAQRVRGGGRESGRKQYGELISGASAQTFAGGFGGGGEGSPRSA